jgi:hypothetical protein
MSKVELCIAMNRLIFFKGNKKSMQTPNRCSKGTVFLN